MRLFTADIAEYHEADCAVIFGNVPLFDKRLSLGADECFLAAGNYAGGNAKLRRLEQHIFSHAECVRNTECKAVLTENCYDSRSAVKSVIYRLVVNNAGLFIRNVSAEQTASVEHRKVHSADFRSKFRVADCDHHAALTAAGVRGVVSSLENKL